jgi:septal ring factor EnvC (AmiA/AmiB activator)
MTEFANMLPWISAIGVIVAIYMSVKGNKREDCRETSSSAEKLTRISATLDSVRDSVDEIRIEFKTQQKQINDMSERVARVEESDKAAHRRIDSFERGNKNAE